MTESLPRAVAIRPLGLGELLDGAVRLVRRNAGASLAIGLPFALARTVVTVLVQVGTLHTQGSRYWQFLTLLVTAELFGTIRTGTLAPLYSASVVGKPVSLRAALSRAGVAMFPLVGVALLVTVGETAGLLALIVGGVWLWGAWAVAAPAVVLERLGPLAALRRSFTLVTGLFWRTWGIRAMGAIVTYILSALITIPFEALAGYLSGTNPLRMTTEGVSHPSLYLSLLAIGTLLAATVTGPISSAVDVLLYTDLRMRREGMDIVMGLRPLPPRHQSDTSSTASVPA